MKISYPLSLFARLIYNQRVPVTVHISCPYSPLHRINVGRLRGLVPNSGVFLREIFIQNSFGPYRVVDNLLEEEPIEQSFTSRSIPLLNKGGDLAGALNTTVDL